MNNNINTFLDNITQQELEYWEQIDLIDMDDKLAQKRIQKMVNCKLKQKRNKKFIAVAAVWCIIAITAITTKPVQAMLERIFHFVPNVGIVESDTVYDVEILCGELKKENVTAELKDCYVKDNFLYGTILITDSSPYDISRDTVEQQDTMMKEMYEKYAVSCYHAQQKSILYFGHHGYHISNDERQISKDLQMIISKSDKNKYYEIEVEGFEQKLSFYLKEAKQISDLKQIGSTVTQNGSSISAIAEMTEQGVKVSYYAICSEEAQTIHQFGENAVMQDFKPHFETIPDAVYECYLKTKSGKILSPMKRKPYKENGGEAIFEATKKDFPATFYYTALSAKTEEFEFVDMPIPKVGQTLQTDIVVPFEYGTVKILSVKHTQEIDYTGVYKEYEDGKMIAQKGLMDKLIIDIDIEPNQKKRLLYRICTKIAEDGALCYVTDTTQQSKATFILNPKDLKQKQTIKIQFDEPTYFIEGEYAIPVKLK